MRDVAFIVVTEACQVTFSIGAACYQPFVVDRLTSNTSKRIGHGKKIAGTVIHLFEAVASRINNGQLLPSAVVSKVDRVTERIRLTELVISIIKTCSSCLTQRIGFAQLVVEFIKGIGVRLPQCIDFGCHIATIIVEENCRPTKTISHHGFTSRQVVSEFGAITFVVFLRNQTTIVIIDIAHDPST